MVWRDLYRYAGYWAAVLVVVLPFFLFNVTLHNYFYVPVSPLENSIQWTTSVVSGMGQWITSRSRLIDRYETLRERNRRLRQQNRSLHLMNRRRERLVEEMGLPADTEGLRPTAARVTRSQLSAWERTVEIDRGTGSGVARGDPVVNVVGDSWVLYGQVQETWSGRSRVVTTSDPRFRIGVVIDGIPGRQFVARGHGQAGLSVAHFPRILDVPLEAAVRTAPASSIAPRGLLIGHVKQVDRSEIRPRTGDELMIEPVMSAEIPSVLWVLVNS
jgi:cell shape-determining protein MreC